MDLASIYWKDAALVLLLVKRPRSLMRWARRAWVGWKLWSGLRARAAPR